MKKRLPTLICVMLFLCQNSLYVMAEAASVIRTENKKTTKEQETSSENDEEQDVLWIPAVYQGINTEFGTYYAYETNLIFEISDEEKNLIATDLMRCCSGNKPTGVTGYLRVNNDINITIVKVKTKTRCA